jgi:hypothetical protein
MLGAYTLDAMSSEATLTPLKAVLCGHLVVTVPIPVIEGGVILLG